MCICLLCCCKENEMMKFCIVVYKLLFDDVFVYLCEYVDVV